MHGHSARFIRASDMLHDLAAQNSTTTLARRLHRYTTPTVLVIDEVGYLSYDARYAELLFEVVTRRYQSPSRPDPYCSPPTKSLENGTRYSPTPPASALWPTGLCTVPGSSAWRGRATASKKPKNARSAKPKPVIQLHARSPENHAEIPRFASVSAG